jgi:Glycerophosphoryl diester phosphodiesterase family
MTRRILVAAFAALCLAAGAEEPTPLAHAHAHNDYEHPHPLLDALDHGFCSIEADIFLTNSALLVAHDWKHVTAKRTLEGLYLDPLQERVQKNGGRVYRDGPEATLLIDIKTGWPETYARLKQVLSKYHDMLSSYTSAGKNTRAIRVIITGNRSKEMFKGETTRWAAYDGDLTDLDSSAPADVIPWISSNWVKTFNWNGHGVMPENEKALLHQIAAKAHARGRLLRFWGGPDNPTFWEAILDSGVDLINTDDLAGAEKFLLKRNPGPAKDRK